MSSHGIQQNKSTSKTERVSLVPNAAGGTGEKHKSLETKEKPSNGKKKFLKIKRIDQFHIMEESINIYLQINYFHACITSLCDLLTFIPVGHILIRYPT